MMTPTNAAKCSVCGADRIGEQPIIVVTATIPELPCRDAREDTVLSVHDILYKAGFNTGHNRTPDATALLTHHIYAQRKSSFTSFSSVIDALKYGLFRCSCHATVSFPGEQSWPETLVLNLRRDVSVNIYSYMPFTSDCNKFDTASLTGVPGPSYTLVCATFMIPDLNTMAYQTTTVSEEFSLHLTRSLPVSMIFVQDEVLFREQMQQLENDAIFFKPFLPIPERRDFIIKRLCPQVSQICSCDEQIAEIALLNNGGNVEMAIDSVLQAVTHNVLRSFEASVNVLEFLPLFTWFKNLNFEWKVKFVFLTPGLIQIGFLIEHSYWLRMTENEKGSNLYITTSSPFNCMFVASWCFCAFFLYSIFRAQIAQRKRQHTNMARWLKLASASLCMDTILFVISWFVSADEIREYEKSRQ
jgi:hypothetical protein